MKRIITLTASTLVLTAGAMSVSSPATAAPTNKWKAQLAVVQEVSAATGSAQIVQTRSKKAPIYSVSVNSAGVASQTCYEVSTSADGITRTALGSATSSLEGALKLDVKVSSMDGISSIVVSVCGGPDVLAGGPFVARQ